MPTDAAAVGQEDREVTTELFCFLNTTRPCASECMAHTVYEPEGKDYEGQQWAHCLLLINAHKIGKHTVALAQQAGTLLVHVDSLLRFLKVKKADDARGPLPPPPRGG